MARGKIAFCDTLIRYARPTSLMGRGEPLATWMTLIHMANGRWLNAIYFVVGSPCLNPCKLLKKQDGDPLMRIENRTSIDIQCSIQTRHLSPKATSLQQV